MPCITTKLGILCFANINFECPACKEIYSDDNDIYNNRLNKNKSGITKIKCECCETNFYLTNNYKGDFVTFLKT
jgi:hypothetical protein